MIQYSQAIQDLLDDVAKASMETEAFKEAMSKTGQAKEDALKEVHARWEKMKVREHVEEFFEEILRGKS